MKKILLLCILCFSFLSLAACSKEDTPKDETIKVVRQEEGIMQDIIDGVKSAFE